MSNTEIWKKEGAGEWERETEGKVEKHYGVAREKERERENTVVQEREKERENTVVKRGRGTVLGSSTRERP